MFKVADLCPVGTVAWLLVVFVVVVSNSAEFDAWTDVMSGLVEFSVFFFHNTTGFSLVLVNLWTFPVIW